MADFETFHKTLVALKREPTITIQKRGTMSLNKAAHMAIDSPGAVELLFDAARRVVGLHPVDARARHAYPVRSSTGHENGPFVVSAMAFLHFYDIQPSETLRRFAHVRDGVLCVDLDEPATPVSSNRAKDRLGANGAASVAGSLDVADDLPAQAQHGA